MKLIKDSYGLLGVHPGVGPGLVRRAFRRAAAECHPDLSSVSGSEEFIRLRKAFKLALGYEQGRQESGRRKREKGPKPGEEPGIGLEPAYPDLVLTLNLTPAEARKGLMTVVAYKREIPCRICRAGCPGCRGAGFVMTQGAGPGKGFLVRRVCPLCQGRSAPSCPLCAGLGRVEEEARAHLLVPAQTDGSELLVIPGMGHQTPARTGDLILDIAIG